MESVHRALGETNWFGDWPRGHSEKKKGSSAEKNFWAGAKKGVVAEGEDFRAREIGTSGGMPLRAEKNPANRGEPGRKKPRFGSPPPG